MPCKVVRHLVTTRPVVTPEPDRRKRGDWRAVEVIPTGTRMRLFEIDVAMPGDRSLIRRELRSADLSPYEATYGVMETREPLLFESLLAAAADRPATLRERLDEYDVSAEDVCTYLQVTDEQLAAAADMVRKRDEEQGR